VLNVARCGWAVMLLVRGRPERSRVDCRSRGQRTFARTLAVRHFAQAALLHRDHSPRALTAGAGVDLLHATTVGALAVVRPAWRRLALSSVASSLLLALGALALSRNAVSQEAAHVDARRAWAARELQSRPHTDTSGTARRVRG